MKTYLYRFMWIILGIIAFCILIIPIIICCIVFWKQLVEMDDFLRCRNEEDYYEY